MKDWFIQLFCKHEFKKLKDDSFICKICDKIKPKTVANIRKTNSYHSNMMIIKRQTKINKEKERNESVRT